MRFLAVLLPLLVLTFALPAQAGQPEAREAARLNNCTPKKIEIYQNSMGATGSTIYRVTCNLPKSLNADKGAPDALLISCQESICTLLRPVSSSQK